MTNVMCSTNNYSREEAVTRLKSRHWFKASDKDLQEQILSLPEVYNGFMNDLSDREDVSMEFEIQKIVDMYLADSSVIPVFMVKSNFTGKIYERTYVSYRKGRHHALRGLILLEENGMITDFVVRKCSRFEVNKVVYESIGSIYAPIQLRDDPRLISSYVETELAKILRTPKLSTSRFIELGNVNPDGSVADLVIGLYTTILKVDNATSFKTMIEKGQYDDKGYLYSFEVWKINELLSFLGKTDDSYLLSIFGRLQALNVIKL